MSSFACGVHVSNRCVNSFLDAFQVVCWTGRKSWMFTCACVGVVECLNLCLVGFIIAWDCVCDCRVRVCVGVIEGESVEVLPAIVAECVVNSSLTSVKEDILTTVKATRAPVVFDTNGGGTLVMDHAELLDGRSKGTTLEGAHVRGALARCRTTQQVFLGRPPASDSRPREELRIQHLST